MTKHLVRWLLALACSLLVVPPVLADAGGRLASVEWLQKNLQRGDLLLIDASSAKAYAAKHIAGAVNVDVFSFGGKDLQPAEMERLIQSWGVSPGKKIVVYDAGGTYLATSLFWDLLHAGVPAGDLLVLDGGLSKWQAAGGEVTKDPTPAPKGTFRIKPREDVRVRLGEFLVASGDPANHALVEALEPAQHFGGAKFFDRAGHVPNAILLPSADFFNADKTFKSPEEMRRMMAYLGVRPDQTVLTHCGGGIAASVPFFAAKYLLDFPKVKLYKESQLEWLRDDRGLPFWTYDAPHMTRDRNWLSGWGSQMMRMFGVAKLAVIDVRPAASFKQAHLPFAINIPADEFRRHLHSPAKLAEVLGAAGIDAAHETVIVSDGGLNPDSALAYIALEKIGQKRVSVLAESVDEWGFAGLPLNKEADAKKPPQTGPVVPTSYPANLRGGIIAREAGRTQGPYPKIYIASGKSLPAKLPEGKVVHVPYTDLVAANGTPKPANDIWNALVKAGVPRYAELVTVSDEPGEAAANYFLLKLMGYPDVTVLAM